MGLVVAPDDPRLTWQGAVSLQRADEWVMPWRIPHRDRVLFPEPLLERAAMPSGARIAFHSDTTTLAGSIEPQAEMSAIDLCCNREFVASVPLSGKDAFRFNSLPPGQKLIELWLPMFGQFKLRNLELSGGASVAPFDDTRPRWITYGSSITHCSGAESPTETWPAIVARKRGLNLTSLGFGGQCHLDPMIARLIRDLPADFISMCLGINIYGGATLGPRSFRPAIVGSVMTIRDGHPDVPIVLMSPIASPPREELPNPVGFTLKMMRQEVAAAVEILYTRGDKNVHYVDGLEILGPGPAFFLEDLCHPTTEGYKTIGRNFLEKVIAKVFP